MRLIWGTDKRGLFDYPNRRLLLFWLDYGALLLDDATVFLLSSCDFSKTIGKVRCSFLIFLFFVYSDSCRRRVGSTRVKIKRWTGIRRVYHENVSDDSLISCWISTGSWQQLTATNILVAWTRNVYNKRPSTHIINPCHFRHIKMIWGFHSMNLFACGLWADDPKNHASVTVKMRHDFIHFMNSFEICRINLLWQ